MVQELTPAPSTPANLLRRQMEAPLRRLSFDGELEQEFRTELRAIERRSALFTLGFALVLWVFYLALDAWRFFHLMGDSAQQPLLYGVVVPRWMVMVVFVCAALVLRHRRVSTQRWQTWQGTLVVACAAVIIVSTYVLRSLGLQETPSAIVMTVVIALYPLGVVFRRTLAVAVLIWLMVLVAGFVLLTPKDHGYHLMMVAVTFVTLLLSAVMAYFRERAQRQQFLLRKLLDWEAGHDPLTGLANRRQFSNEFIRLQASAELEKEQLYLALVDIDHFKLYNDAYGHVAGDQALTEVAQALSGFARRPFDLAARMGGEEFALLLYGDSNGTDGLHLRQLPQAFERLSLPHKASPSAPHITVSGGVVRVGANDTLDSVLRRADRLLYQAKHEGRNRIVYE